MFGECFDFAPAPARGRGKQKPMMPPSQAPVVVQLTPQEQANQLANTVGLDPSIMKGCPPDLLQGINAADLRVAVRYAANQVQEGRVDTEKTDEYLSDFLAKRIALMPLATRFPLLAEWAGKGGDNFGEKMPLAKTSGPAQSSASSFISFDSLPGGSYPKEHVSGGTGPSQQPTKPQKTDKVTDKKSRKKDAPVPVQVQEEEVSWQKSVELGPSQVRNARVAKAFLETVQTDSLALEKDKAVRREQEAKKAASKFMMSFEQTKAAVDSGMLAAKKSQQLLRGDEGKRSHAESVAAAFTIRRDADTAEKEGSKLEKSASASEVNNSQGGEGGHEDDKRRRRHRDDSRGRPQDDDYDRGGRLTARADNDDRRQRRHDYAGSRSRSRSCADGRSRRRFRDVTGDGQVSSERRTSSRRKRSRSADDISRSRLSDTLDRKANEGSSGPFSSGIVKSGASDGKIATPGAVSKPEPKLRILACKGTWAEYVDQDTGEHVYKNVLTNEMTKKKPAEFGAVITDSMNQRRLAWLQGQRNAAMLSDMQQMQQMQIQQMQQMQQMTSMQQRPQGFA